MNLTEEQWDIIKEYIPSDPKRADGRGRPWSEQRPALDGILWILRTGAPWQDLPERYGAPATVHRRFQRWVKLGVMRKILEGLAEDLGKRGRIDVSETFLDGSFSAAKKGAPKLEKPSVARGPRSWQLQTLTVFLSPCTRKLLLPPK